METGVPSQLQWERPATPPASHTCCAVENQQEGGGGGGWRHKSSRTKLKNQDVRCKNMGEYSKLVELPAAFSFSHNNVQKATQRNKETKVANI